MEEDIEIYVRRLRDIVYCSVSTDVNWDSCKIGWMKPDNVKFLE